MENPENKNEIAYENYEKAIEKIADNLDLAHLDEDNYNKIQSSLEESSKNLINMSVNLSENLNKMKNDIKKKQVSRFSKCFESLKSKWDV